MGWTYQNNITILPAPFFQGVKEVWRLGKPTHKNYTLIRDASQLDLNKEKVVTRDCSHYINRGILSRLCLLDLFT
jgi:hypothetical protein